jgi:hypothetical protein
MKSRANSTLPVINAISVTDIYFPYYFMTNLAFWNKGRGYCQVYKLTLWVCSRKILEITQ